MMTFEEKRDIALEYCGKNAGICNECSANGDRKSWCDLYVHIDDATEEDLDYFIQKYIPDAIKCEEVSEEEPTEVENDVIKRPKHYCREGAMECIEEMILLFGKETVKHFCLCNIWKYRYRSNDKNGEEDIKKSDQYVRIYERLCNE